MLCRESYGKRVFTRQPECTVFIDSGASGRRCAEGRWLRDGRDTVMRLLGGASRGRPKRLVCQDLCGLQASSQFPFTRLHPTVLLQSRSLTYQAHRRQLKLYVPASKTTLAGVFTTVLRSFTRHRSCLQFSQPPCRFAEPFLAYRTCRHLHEYQSCGLQSTPCHESCILGYLSQHDILC